MKHQFHIVAALLLISTACVHVAALDRHLSRQSPTVDINSKVWDFSQCDDVVKHPVYRTYGDSLISEIYDGCRQWYALKNDSAFYLGEETRFYKTLLDAPILTSTFGNPMLIGRDSCEASGVYYKSYAMGQSGDYESLYPINGRMIIGADNEISAKAVTERRRFVSWIISDTLPDGFTTTKEYIRTRWFVTGNQLPVALQITENVLHNDRTVSSTTKTFIIQDDEIAVTGSTLDENTQHALDNAEITIANGIVRIEGDFPENTVLTLYISNISGTQFGQEPVAASHNGNVWEIPLPAVPLGKYILTISAGTPSNRKIAVTI